jgi:hypothetical protein
MKMIMVIMMTIILIITMTMVVMTMIDDNKMHINIITNSADKNHHENHGDINTRIAEMVRLVMTMTMMTKTMLIVSQQHDDHENMKIKIVLMMTRTMMPVCVRAQAR